MTLMMNADLFGWSDDLSLFAGPDCGLASEVGSRPAEQHRHDDHDGKSELQKLLEGTTAYGSSPLPSPTPPGDVHGTRPSLTPHLCDDDISWSDTILNLFELTGDAAAVTPPSMLDELDMPAGLVDAGSLLGDFVGLPPVAAAADSFTSLRVFGGVVDDSSGSTLLDKVAGVDVATTSPYPDIFDDVLGLYVDTFDVTPDATSYDAAVLSPVSVEDVESLLASEPSSPAHALCASPPPVVVTPKRRSRGRKAPYERASAASVKAKLEDRRQRKKQQNKVAALRYREKKRVESGAICDEEATLEAHNDELRGAVAKLEQELQYLKDLMAEVACVKAEAAN